VKEKRDSKRKKERMWKGGKEGMNFKTPRMREGRNRDHHPRPSKPM
jgi:hypothetical protein